MNTLKENIILVTLSVGVWTARKQDKKESKEVTARNNADDDRATVYKQLIAKDILSEITKVNNAAHTYFYSVTVPWGYDQTYAASPKLAREIINKLDDFKRNFYQKVNEFLPLYIDIRENEKYHLGTLFNPLDYPTADQIKNKFYFRFGFKAVTEANDFRVTAGQEAMDELQRRIQEENKSNIQAATNKLKERITDTVNKLVEGLETFGEVIEGAKASKTGKVKTKTFRDTLIGNLETLIELTPTMNIANDPGLNLLVDELKPLIVINPKTLRENTTARKEILEKAKAIAAKLNGTPNTEPEEVKTGFAIFQ